MIAKLPILPSRVRKIPKSFSWIDHRLVRDHHIKKCSHADLALYFFLTCVGDDKGLSYYKDESIMKILSMDWQTFKNAKEKLCQVSLIAWKKPIYQVLSLEPQVCRNTPTGQPMSLGDILKNAMEVRHD